MEARAFCVPGRDLHLPGEARLRELGIQVGHVRGIHGELAGAQDLVDARIEERRQRHRPDDRNAVFEFASSCVSPPGVMS